jgi:N-dimethylarginine dimethylaminohydrolase
MNHTVLMSGADFFDDKSAINVLMNDQIAVNVEVAVQEHQAIQEALESAGVKVIKIDPPKDCQDGVYTANWALVRNGKALMSRLPNSRKPEESYALEAVKQQGLVPIVLPPEVERFSGQGDALPCGDIVFTQSPYRTSENAHQHIKDLLGFKTIVNLETKPARNIFGMPKINKVTGWPDSPTYDIDLAIAIIKPPTDNQKGLIAYCPDVFKRKVEKF